ncbi:glycosyl transferase [Allostella sp. ATCC 35155]|nr:glycosyl transferase [Stella sp. ATCC 35155]
MIAFALVVQHLRPGGIETLALDLLESGDGRLVALEGSRDGALDAWPRLRGVADRLEFLDKPGGMSPATLLRLRTLLRRWRPAAVHTHHVGPLLYGGIAARLAGVRRIVHTEHDAWHLASPARRRLVAALLATVRPRLVAVSSAVAEGVRRTVPGARPTIVRNGISLDRFVPGERNAARRCLGLPGEVPIVGTAARLEPVKGIGRLIDAATGLPGVTIAIAGDGSLRAELEERARSLGIADRVRFLGPVGDMPAFYRAVDVFCLPSLAEGLPIAPLEAQACGRPVVATDVGGTRESLCPSTGRLVPSDDQARLTAALRDALAAGPAHAGRDFVTRVADLRQTVGAYRRLYTA